ncbi:hypothetical protein JTB14_032826 [Gonioctena quinquepunctata]|nr:hypothetical protein JTB14_032826 [Gonioctena quinquepunctata]
MVELWRCCIQSGSPIADTPTMKCSSEHTTQSPKAEFLGVVTVVASPQRWMMTSFWMKSKTIHHILREFPNQQPIESHHGTIITPTTYEFEAGYPENTQHELNFAGKCCESIMKINMFSIKSFGATSLPVKRMVT